MSAQKRLPPDAATQTEIRILSNHPLLSDLDPEDRLMWEELCVGNKQKKTGYWSMLEGGESAVFGCCSSVMGPRDSHTLVLEQLGKRFSAFSFSHTDSTVMELALFEL